MNRRQALKTLLMAGAAVATSAVTARDALREKPLVFRKRYYFRSLSDMNDDMKRLEDQGWTSFHIEIQNGEHRFDATAGVILKAKP